jgi:hypothetical protein
LKWKETLKQATQQCSLSGAIDRYADYMELMWLSGLSFGNDVHFPALRAQKQTIRFRPKMGVEG